VRHAAARDDDVFRVRFRREEKSCEKQREGKRAGKNSHDIVLSLSFASMFAGSREHFETLPRLS